MSYILIGLVLALVAWIIGVIRFSRRSRRLAATKLQNPPGMNRFVSAASRQGGSQYANVQPRPVTVDPMPGARARQPRSDQRGEKPDREQLKSSCLGLLDAAAIEHPAGHGKLFARYVLRSEEGDRIELMFEKGEKSPAHLWLTRRHALPLLTMGMEFRDYPASELYQPTEPGGKPVYGRQSALKSMRDLANADLVRLKIERVEQMEMILAKLVAVEQAV
jgi:hypothetical protein